MRELLNNINASINVYGNGLIELSADVSNALSLRDGDAVTFTTDDYGNFYVKVFMRQAKQSVRSVRGIVRRGSENGFSRLNWKKMADLLLQGSEKAGYSVGEIITQPDGEKAVTIITRKNYYA